MCINFIIPRKLASKAILKLYQLFPSMGRINILAAFLFRGLSFIRPFQSRAEMFLPKALIKIVVVRAIMTPVSVPLSTGAKEM